MPAKNGKQPDEKFPLKLTVKQRESLMQATRLRIGLRTRIKEASKDQQFVEFTKKELEQMLGEIDISLDNATPSDQKRLNAVVGKIFDLLADIEEKQLRDKRQAITKPGAIYQFKVTLKESHPPIWRRIQVPDCTLGELHEVLQVVMDWGNSHLHQFIVNRKYFGEATHDDLDMEVEDEDGIGLSDIYTGENTPRIVYEYDFGDGWLHEIILEKILEPEPRVTYPCCLEGARACPPEDVGGIWGYAEFLEAISDPNHEDHDEMVEWVGGEFDPERFSVDEVNKELG